MTCFLTALTKNGVIVKEARVSYDRALCATIVQMWEAEGYTVNTRWEN